MSGRFVSLGVAIALLVALAGAIIAACYQIPTPDCGFLCGPDDACPDGYTCAEDHACHRVGSPSGLVCVTPDAAIPDAHLDGSIDVPPDAPLDAPPDAPPDAPATAA